MKHLKILCFAVAVAATMALLGAGTASATVLCETNVTSNCGPSWHVKPGSKVTFSATGTWVVKGPFSITIVTCTEAITELSTENTGGAAQTVGLNIEKIIYANCNRAVTVNQNTTGTLEIHHIANTDNGTVTGNDSTFLVHEVPFPFPSTCAYQTNNTHTGTITGSLTTPTWHTAATVPTHTSGCPDGTMEGTWEYTGSTPFIVSAS